MRASVAMILADESVNDRSVNQESLGGLGRRIAGDRDLGHGSATRELIYVEDAAEAIMPAWEPDDGVEPFNLDPGQEISIRDLIGLIGGRRASRAVSSGTPPSSTDSRAGCWTPRARPRRSASSPRRRSRRGSGARSSGIADQALR
jgi:nucleoside-diphosphate-sugar epimerase